MDAVAVLKLERENGALRYKVESLEKENAFLRAELDRLKAVLGAVAVPPRPVLAGAGQL